MTQKDLWISALRRIHPTIQKNSFITWFNNTAILERKGDIVVIGVPSAYVDIWIRDKYKLKIIQALQELDSGISGIEFEVHQRLGVKENNEGVDTKSLVAVESEKKVRKVRNVNEVNVMKGKDKGHVSSQMLNDRYNLHNFIIGKDNRLPHAACQAVADAPGGVYNPLYIYGGVGLGKTHLIQAVGNEILKNYPEKIVKYITAERFVTEVVDAIGKRYMKSFKAQYRNVDVFLVDDIQFFARKDSSQQELFHTFNELHDNNKQIVLTSDRSPSDLDGLDVRLKSRFGMGMVVELLAPDFETRMAILRQKSQEFEVLLDPEITDFISNNVIGSVRELEGVLRQVVAESQLSDRVPTIKSVAEIVRRLNKAQKIIGYDLVEGDGACAKNGQDVMKIVSEYYKVSVGDLTGKDRHKEYMVPRQLAMYLIKNELDESYEKIGGEFGGRNHTTVMHACSRTAKRLRKDIRLIRDANTIKREMGL
ncbi:MAG: chromosomal replication initiator protein DnaA [Candidatus Peregrinibacteria bacterium]